MTPLPPCCLKVALTWIYQTRSDCVCTCVFVFPCVCVCVYVCVCACVCVYGAGEGGAYVYLCVIASLSISGSAQGAGYRCFDTVNISQYCAGCLQDYGKTALMISIERKYDVATALLVEKGADLNVTNHVRV